MHLEYKKEENTPNITVKQIMYEHFGLSSRLVARLKNNGGIKVNGKVVTVRYEMNVGDVLTLLLEDRENSDIEMRNVPLDVIYEDEYILAVNKPRAMPTHPSFRHQTDTLANAVMYRYRDKPFTFRAITRLDEDTSGVVLIARDADTAFKLSLMLQNEKIEKQYFAVCDNAPDKKSGVVDAPIVRDGNSIIKRKISSEGKNAITYYEVVKEFPDKSALLQVWPKTGRTHQIRLHLSHIGCPVKNDFLYGRQKGNEPMLLHCHSLTLIHPKTNKKLVLQAPIPPYFFERKCSFFV